MNDKKVPDREFGRSTRGSEVLSEQMYCDVSRSLEELLVRRTVAMTVKIHKEVQIFKRICTHDAFGEHVEEVWVHCRTGY